MKRMWCFPFIEETEAGDFATIDGTVLYATDPSSVHTLKQVELLLKMID
jgi:hypothetical protein